MSRSKRRRRRAEAAEAGGATPGRESPEDREAADPGADPPAAGPGPPVVDRWAAVLLAIAAMLFVRVVMLLHRTPSYGEETDLLGEYLPHARDLLAGRFVASDFLARGPVYPLLVAFAARLSGGDLFFAARAVNVTAAVGAAAFSYLLVRDFAGRAIALGVLVAMLANPVFLRATLEAGTDLPAMAFALAATWCVLRARPRDAALAGAAAALAILTRPSCVVLIPAALVAFLAGKERARRAIAWGVALVLPLGLWSLVMRLHGAAPATGTRDALNMAYEFYGGTRGWEEFWGSASGASAPFHSYADVVRFAPARFATHLAANLATRWWIDAVRLMPIWIGAFALPGMLLIGRVRRGWPAIGAHFFFTYVSLCFVFYSPRFFLYLLPFYLAGAVGLLLLGPEWIAARFRTPAASLGTTLTGVALLLAAAGASLSVGASDLRAALSEEPTEARDAGLALKAIARPGETLMARKPHAAFFAGLHSAPLPQFNRFEELIANARVAGADYLLVSPIEIGLRDRLAFLADSGVSLPGLRPVLWNHASDRHFYAVYRFTRETVPDSVFAESLLVTVRNFALRRPNDAWAVGQYGQALVTDGRYRESLEVLAISERLDPSNQSVLRYEAIAHSELGEYDAALVALSRLSGADGDSAWTAGFAGHIRLQQGLYAEARTLLARACTNSPANRTFLSDYASACYLARDWTEAAGAAERLVQLAPDDRNAREIGARAWTQLHRPDRARVLLGGAGAEGPESTAPAAPNPSPASRR